MSAIADVLYESWPYAALAVVIWGTMVAWAFWLKAYDSWYERYIAEDNDIYENTSDHHREGPKGLHRDSWK